MRRQRPVPLESSSHENDRQHLPALAQPPTPTLVDVDQLTSPLARLRMEIQSAATKVSLLQPSSA
jgi:hypothetical protein